MTVNLIAAAAPVARTATTQYTAPTSIKSVRPDCGTGTNPTSLGSESSTSSSSRLRRQRSSAAPVVARPPPLVDLSDSPSRRPVESSLADW